MFPPLKYIFKRFFLCFLSLAFLGLMLYPLWNVPAFLIPFKSYSYSIGLRYFLLILFLLSITLCGFDWKILISRLKHVPVSTFTDHVFVYIWAIFGSIGCVQPLFPNSLLTMLQIPLTMLRFLLPCSLCDWNRICAIHLSAKITADTWMYQGIYNRIHGIFNFTTLLQSP